MFKTFNGVKLYDLDSIHEILGLSKVSIRAYIKRGLIKARKIGIKWYVTEKNLFDFINQNQKMSDNYLQDSSNGSSSSDTYTDKEPVTTSGMQNVIDNQGTSYPELIDLTKVLPLESVVETWEFWLDTSLRLTYTSPLCEKITGYSTIEFMQNPGLVQQIVYEDDKAGFLKYINNPVSENLDVFKLRVVSRSGSLKLLSVTKKFVYNQSGDLMGTQVICRDITNEMIISVSKSQLNGFLEKVANELDLIVIVLDDNMHVIAFNNRAYLLSLIGFKSEISVGENILDLVPSSYKSDDAEIFARVLSGSTVRVFRQASMLETMKKNYLMHAFPIHFREANSNDICILLEDIENQLVRLKNYEYPSDKYFEKFDDVKTIVIATNKARELLYINNYGQETTGWRQSEVVGTTITDYMDAEGLAKLPVESDKFWQTGVNFGFPLMIKCKNGSMLKVRLMSFIEKNIADPIVVSFLKIQNSAEL